MWHTVTKDNQNNHEVEATVRLFNGNITVVTAQNYTKLIEELDKLNWKSISSERRQNIND